MRHLATNGRTPGGDALALTDRDFVVHDRLPAGLVPVVLAGLAPRLRALLLADGTITRTVEAWTLRRPEVRVLGQQAVRCPAGSCSLLQLPHDARRIVCRRRVAIHACPETPPLLYAESMILNDRLPRPIAEAVLERRQGIGATLSASRLELRRELVWLGAGTPPGWTAYGAWAVARASRIVLGGVTAIGLVEWFPADRATGDLPVP